MNLLEVIAQTAQGWGIVIGGTFVSFSAVIGIVIAFAKRYFTGRTAVQDRDHRDTLATFEMARLCLKIQHAQGEEEKAQIVKIADAITNDVEKRNKLNSSLRDFNNSIDLLYAQNEEKRAETIKRIIDIIGEATDEKNK